MSTPARNGYKWSVNEILALQREFELLNWDIDIIAEKHKRTPNSIMWKLDQEGFADYNVLYSNYHDLNSHIPVQRKPGIELNYHDDSNADDNVVSKPLSSSLFDDFFRKQTKSKSKSRTIASCNY